MPPPTLTPPLPPLPSELCAPTRTAALAPPSLLPPLPGAAPAPTAASLASLSAREQREVLGESLFPLVLARVGAGERAGKVTGMLLQSTDPGALLAMIQGPPPLIVLDEAVAEAVRKRGE